MTDQPPSPTGHPPALRAPAHQVSRKAPVVWGVGALVRVVLVLAVLFALDRFEIWSPPWWVWTLLAVAGAAYVVGMPVVRYRVHRWESTESAVYTQTGWLSRERRIAPMSRVQTVDYDQSVVGRLVGLASVTVTTASAAGPLRIAALDKPVADRLVEDLTRRAESEPGDAT